MKNLLSIVLLAIPLAACSSTTPMNKDTTLGQLLGIGPISMASSKTQSQVGRVDLRPERLISDCLSYAITANGLHHLHIKEHKLTQLSSGNYLASLYLINPPYSAETLPGETGYKPEILHSAVCEFDKNGKFMYEYNSRTKVIFNINNIKGE